MNTKLILLTASIAAFSSCSTMYKTGQTPDDVYFSPTRSTETYVNANRDETPSQPANNYYSIEDRAIRLGISNYRHRNFDNDFGYNYSPYDFSFSSGHGYYNNAYYGNGYGNNYDPYYTNIYYGNYYYNPYYNAYPVYVLPAGPIKNNTPRITNLSGYTNNYNNVNTPTRSGLLAPHPSRGYNNSNTNNSNGRTSSGLGNILNKVLAPASTNNTNNSNNNVQQTNTTRTYTPPPASNSSSSNSSSSSCSSSGGGRISRPQ